MFINFNTKLFAKVFILFLAVFLPSCMARDIYNADREAKEEEAQLRREDRESEGKNAVGSIARTQESYHYETGTFGNNFDDLGLVLPPSQSYDVEIVEADKNIAIFTAKAKKEDISSFAGIIEYQSGEYKSILCRTNDSAKSIQLPIDAQTCGSGSRVANLY